MSEERLNKASGIRWIAKLVDAFTQGRLTEKWDRMTKLKDDPTVHENIKEQLTGFLEHANKNSKQAGPELQNEVTELSQALERTKRCFERRKESLKESAAQRFGTITDSALDAMERAAPSRSAAKHIAEKLRITQKLVRLEYQLAKLARDYSAGKQRQNRLVAQFGAKGKSELKFAYDALLNDQLETADAMADVCWLHTNFGRQIVDAEIIEHLLGESDYLELTEEAKAAPHTGGTTSAAKTIEELFTELEADISSLRAMVKESALDRGKGHA